MFDSIVENLYILVPIAFVLVIRILGILQKRQAEARGSSGISSGDGDDEDIRVSPSGPAVAAKPRPAAVQRLSEEPPALNAPPAEEPAKPRGPAPAPKPAGTEKRPFPQNLDFLPPLKRAVALSEILGPPRGM
jgi:hypothetical protein